MPPEKPVAVLRPGEFVVSIKVMNDTIKELAKQMQKVSIAMRPKTMRVDPESSIWD